MDLLESVDRLTKARRVTLVQPGHVHLWRNVAPEGDEPLLVCDFEAGHDYVSDDDTAVHREDESALEQLRLRIANSMERSGGSQQASHRIPFDATALDLFDRIDGRVRAWHADLGERADTSVPLSSVLRQWYVRFNVLTRSEQERSDYQRVLDRWWDQVRDVIEPPVRQEILAPCPVCHATWVLHDDSAENAPRAMWVLWRDDLEDCEARCLSCGKRWVGVYELRSLRISLDDAA